jgi:polysaccharide pyruvyl transferase WcaK-like protein
MRNGRRIVLAGTLYSANLGDAMIADCLTHLLQRVDPDADVRLLDLDGRAEPEETEEPAAVFGPVRLGKRHLPLDVLRRLIALRAVARWRGGGETAAARVWADALRAADRVVIGGGQLLKDDNLNFPLKIYSVARRARRMQLPVHVAVCGVGEHWSPAAAALFRPVLWRAATVTVRDSRSLERLRRHVPGVPASASFDPAIWAADVYGPAPARGDAVGLGVMAPEQLRFFMPGGRRIPEERIVAFWVGLVTDLNSAGRACELFTNGLPTDDRFARAVHGAVHRAGPARCTLAPRPVKPRELALRISGYAGIAAARLHACLAALSYRVPVVGLSWDDKVASVFADAGRPETCVDLFTLPQRTVARRLLARMETRADVARLRTLKDLALHAAECVLREGQDA